MCVERKQEGKAHEHGCEKKKTKGKRMLWWVIHILRVKSLVLMGQGAVEEAQRLEGDVVSIGGNLETRGSGGRRENRGV